MMREIRGRSPVQGEGPVRRRRHAACCSCSYRQEGHLDESAQTSPAAGRSDRPCQPRCSTPRCRSRPRRRPRLRPPNPRQPRRLRPRGRRPTHRRSTAGGRECTRCPAAAACWSTSRRSRAGTSSRTWSPSARCHTAAKPPEAIPGHRQARSRNAGLRDRSAGQFPEDAHRRGELRTMPKETVARNHREHRQDDSGRRAGHRARPGAGEHRQEPGHREERRGRQGGSPAGLFQHDARRDREPRRRTDLEPDQGERSQVRGQHELGSLPAWTEQHLLPAEQRRLAEGHRRQWPVDPGRHAPGKLRQPAGGAELERREGHPARQTVKAVPTVFVSHKPAELIPRRARRNSFRSRGPVSCG